MVLGVPIFKNFMVKISEFYKLVLRDFPRANLGPVIGPFFPK